jgi:transposase-like protein
MCWQPKHKKAPGVFTHLFVAIDKFSKWIEVGLVATITADKARDFILNIVHRFGVPNRIITDNGTQFTLHHAPSLLTTYLSGKNLYAVKLFVSITFPDR